jgi:hypothetical protein
MPPAERSQVGVSVVVTGLDVVHVRGHLVAPDAFVAMSAAMTVSAKNASSDPVPVGRESGSSV